ncbi:hypothetical protein GGS24DRAFT_504991 [Hypoxylon argillaceum]|nr:hypothetical protein GGS24DRAFT_504991 [Hypoxylon argillaceum]KAI1155455.1 hypothetical protein F4825DRAFT_469216 [Nemania diffusa]
MASFKSSRASWMYADPYAYQYSDLDPEDDVPALPQGREMDAAGSNLCELEGSTPTHSPRYELAADPVLGAVRENHHTISEPNSPCGLSRNRLSNARRSVRYSVRRKHAMPAETTPAPYSSSVCPPQPPSSGLIPVVEGIPMPTQHYVPDTTLPQKYVQPCLSRYTDGLIPVDENATTPKEPSSDFDAILRNIGPIPKKGKENTRRERSSRYYDRYSSNFG